MATPKLSLTMYSDTCRQSTIEGRLMAGAKERVNRPLSYEWNEMEQKIVEHFFTNSNGRVFFMRGLPASLVGQFFTMCANRKNDRGMRGMFVDNYLPALLVTQLPECADEFGNNPQGLLAAYKINSIGDLLQHSKTAHLMESLLLSMQHGDLMYDLAYNTREAALLANDNKNMGLFTLCFEGISLLVAQKLQHGRSGFGSREIDSQHTSLLPEGSGREHYLIEDELEAFGADRSALSRLVEHSFDIYHHWRGDQFDGQFPNFLRKKYQALATRDELEVGVIGETCDMLAAFLPACLHTGFAMSIRESDFADVLCSLLADQLPEAVALTDALGVEAKKLGYRLGDHIDQSPWSMFDRGYLTSEGFDQDDYWPQSEVMLRTLGRVAIPTNTSLWLKDLSGLTSQRRVDDDLPDWFRVQVGGFARKVTFQTWCRLQRLPFVMSRRTLLSPRLGFFTYDRSMSEELEKDLLDLHKRNYECANELVKHDVPPALIQYVMALGNMVNVQCWHDLRGWERFIAEETKCHVPRGTRVFFLGCYHALKRMYPTLEQFMHVDSTPNYAFSHCPFPIVASDDKTGKI